MDRLWPVTLGIGVLMAVLVFAFLAFSFGLVYGASFSMLVDGKTWLWVQE